VTSNKESPFYHAMAENPCFLPTNYILTRHFKKKNSKIERDHPCLSSIPPQPGRTPPAPPRPDHGPAATDRVGTPARPTLGPRSSSSPSRTGTTHHVCLLLQVPTPWSRRSSRGVAAELEVRRGRVGQWLGGGFLVFFFFFFFFFF
jgi:hypothetical protein